MFVTTEYNTIVMAAIEVNKLAAKTLSHKVGPFSMLAMSTIKIVAMRIKKAESIMISFPTFCQNSVLFARCRCAPLKHSPSQTYF